MQQRLHYIDWIRVLAFSTLIVFHCAVPFVEHYHWEINSEETSPWITRIIWWVHQWRLPVLFFISGVGVRFSLKKRSIPKFAWERFVRLFIPLVFAIFFITPFQVYFEWLQEGRISGSFAAFYPQVYENVPYPEGAFTWSHMWFVAYLFVFTLLLLPLFATAKLKGIDGLKRRANKLFNWPITHLLLATPFIMYIFWLYVDWPEQGSLIDDWYVFISSITFYVLGFLLSSLPAFWQGCLKYRRYFLIGALILAVTLFAQYFWDWHQFKPRQQDAHLYKFAHLNGLHVWLILLAIIGYCMKYLNRPSSRLQYLNTAVYPFYIMHQAVIIASGYYILQWNLPIAVKLILLVTICLLSVWLLYHFVIRKTKLTRLLFGMRWNKKQ